MTDKILKRFEYYVGENYLPSFQDILPFPFSHLEQETGKNNYDVRFQWICYVVCIFHIFYSTRTLLWGMLYFGCCLSVFILSSINYLVQVDYFIFIVSLLWSWIVVGRLIFCVSLKLLSKPWGWVLIIAVVVQLYFTDIKLIDYQLFAFLYFVLISGYVLFDLGLFPHWYYVGICCYKFYGRLWHYLGYDFFMEVLKIGLHC